ncbi:MAG: Nucleoside-diphosphate-sugar epimerase [Glomeribacter sp. 1016415]|nr:Nucleoside-diphosphate-sugar epimerase [Glomeribacter sp. 1016415]
MIPTRKLRRKRILIVGCGDIGLRCAKLLLPRYRVLALTRQAERCVSLRTLGIVPVVGDLDRRSSLKRLVGLADTVLHLAPPAAHGSEDQRTRFLLAALSRSKASPMWIYASTTGVYGDCAGALVDETRPVRPANERSLRRLSAESQLRAAGARAVLSLRIVRIPGIYASNRLPLARLQAGMFALNAAEDIYTNHIQADDLALILLRIKRLGCPQRIVHAVDDTQMKLADYFDLIADAHGLPRPKRIARIQAPDLLNPTLLSFIRESRRLMNTRLKTELAYQLRYPTVQDFLREHGNLSLAGGHPDPC